ncbi:MAG: amidohydrolase family protein, partial [Novosphingobium sp.]|nr:amidohydrolase family protein [Novosphingobium sp.]
AEIGSGLTGKDRLDAAGKVVAPGFIDVHTHYDPQVLWDRELTPSSWHGVTSVIAGNCGFSVAPVKPEGRDIIVGTLEKVEDMDADAMRQGIEWDFETYGEYLASLDRAGLAINFGGYVGHTAVRAYVMGMDSYEREATPEELETMKAVVVRSLNEGALGFSTDRAGFILGYNGKPVPSVVATQEETEALLAVPIETGKGIAHIAPGENWQWLLDFNRRVGGTVNWSAILAYPREGGRSDFHDKLDLLKQAHDEGVNLVGQVTCRPIIQLLSLKTPYSFSGIPAFQPILAAPANLRAALYRSPEWRDQLRECMDTFEDLPPRWELMRVAETETQKDLSGRTIADIAAERGTDPFETMVDIALAEDLNTRFSVTFANDRDEDIAELLIGKNCIIGLSDAGAHAAQICDSVLTTDFLSRWVRDREVMPLEAAIRKITGELADVMQLDRGYLKEGSPADVVVFDLARLEVGPIRRVHDFPGGAERLIADRPSGIEHVVVNGVPIRRDGVVQQDAVKSGPGRILRHKPNGKG